MICERFNEVYISVEQPIHDARGVLHQLFIRRSLSFGLFIYPRAIAVIYLL